MTPHHPIDNYLKSINLMHTKLMLFPGKSISHPNSALSLVRPSLHLYALSFLIHGDCQFLFQFPMRHIHHKLKQLLPSLHPLEIFVYTLQAPLHLAVINDVSLDILKVLLNHGADLRIADPDGNTAIHLAIEHKRSAMLKILVTGAVERRFNLNTFNYEGFTPLILACLNRSYQDAKFLLDNGADPNVKDMKSGRTALFHAAECHDVNMVELLIQHKADTKIRNFFGTSPHDAMFELEEIPVKIKFSILGRDHQRFQAKKKFDAKGEQTVKRAKLETTPVLKKVNTDDVLCPRIRKK